MGRLEGKVAIITGASRGIGRATAKLFAAEGAKVAVLSRTAEGNDAVVAAIEAAGGIALGIPCDVADAGQITAAVAAVVEAFGGVDILVNNAFDPAAVMSSVAELTVEQLQRNFDTGPIASLRTMQACYPYLKASAAGRVINFGSPAALTGMAPYAPYNMAKEATRALTRTAAREWGADGTTLVEVTKPDGAHRAIFFRDGEAFGADGTQADGSADWRFSVTRDGRDNSVIAFGPERYVIPDAFVVGG